jgi:putative ABC transport system permease protein
MAMSVRERMGEYAVFKTLGFGGPYIAALILGESELIAAMGGGAGILLTFPAAKVFANALGNFIPVFKVTHLTIFMDLGAAVLVGGVAGILPIWRATTVRIAEGLGRMG